MGLFGKNYRYIEDLRDDILEGDLKTLQQCAKFIDKKLDKFGGGFRANDLTVLEAIIILKDGIEYTDIFKKISRLRDDLMVPIMYNIDGQVGSTFLVDVMLHCLDSLVDLFDEVKGQDIEKECTVALLLSYFYADTDIEKAKLYFNIGKRNETKYCIDKIEKYIAEKDIFK